MRSRVGSTLGSFVFLVLAPGTVAGLVPWLLSGWTRQATPAGLDILRPLGLLLAAAGTAVLLDSFRRFALEGRGTPAPIAPTETLVISGLYRHVRNPMYVGVVSAVLGQALWLMSPGLLAYAAATWLAFHLFVQAYEEPTLRARYGDAYERYRAHVPRWIPRRRGWPATPGTAR